MKELIKAVERLKSEDISGVIEERMEEFSRFKGAEIEEIFKEMCFCVMTANCGAEKCLEVHEGVDAGFLTLSQEKLAAKFKDLGYRFPNIRSKYIVENRKKLDDLKEILHSNDEGAQLRDWVAKNIKGLGYKESSHFLRNVGFKEYGIVDFHIADLLEDHGLIEKPKTMTKKKYLEIEVVLKELAQELDLTLAELDLYLWYLETGKVLK